MKARLWKMEDGSAGSPPPAADCPDDGAHGVSRPTLNLWLIVCLLVSVLHLPAFAQSYSIDWYKISGGGGTSTGATYQVTGTIGQPDASGAMSGGPVTGNNYYSLTGGFWSLIAVVQTAGLPNLVITQNGNTVTVSWRNTGNYTLQQNANLALASGWVPTGYQINTANGTNSITIASPTGTLLFRLQQP
jgi:hypothetical protein